MRQQRPAADDRGGHLLDDLRGFRQTSTLVVYGGGVVPKSDRLPQTARHPRERARRLLKLYCPVYVRLHSQCMVCSCFYMYLCMYMDIYVSMNIYIMCLFDYVYLFELFVLIVVAMFILLSWPGHSRKRFGNRYL